jgi:hypothetical protein
MPLGQTWTLYPSLLPGVKLVKVAYTIARTRLQVPRVAKFPHLAVLEASFSQNLWGPNRTWGKRRPTPMDPRPAALAEFLEPYPLQVQELAFQARIALKEMLPPANEIYYDAMSAVCSGFVFTEKVRDCFVNLAVYSDHVTLIFGYGARLSDPEGRLQGKGNQVRHLRIPTLETLQDPYVIDLVHHAAYQATRPEEPTEPKTIIKTMNGPKRRPKP